MQLTNSEVPGPLSTVLVSDLGQRKPAVQFWRGGTESQAMAKGSDVLIHLITYRGFKRPNLDYDHFMFDVL
jgi:hypothetical protein